MVLTERSWGQRYADQNGAGAQDGTSWADRYSFALAPITGNFNLNITGDISLTANKVLPLASAASPYKITGWKSDMSAPATGFDDMPKIDGLGLYTLVPGSWGLLEAFRFTNGSVGFSSASADNMKLMLMEMDNHPGVGVFLDNYLSLSRCRVHSNGANGIEGDTGLNVDECEVYDNVGTGVFPSQTGGAIRNSFIARNNIGIQVSGDTLVSGCTVDSNTNQGIYHSGSTISMATILATLLTNNGVGIDDAWSSAVHFCNLYGNTLDQPVGQTTESLANTTYLNPQYDDVANNLYGINNSDLMNLPIGLLGNKTIGAWQPDAGGGGGVSNVGSLIL